MLSVTSEFGPVHCGQKLTNPLLGLRRLCRADPDIVRRLCLKGAASVRSHRAAEPLRGGHNLTRPAQAIDH